VGGGLAGALTLGQGAAAVVPAALGGLLASVAVVLLAAAWRPGPARVTLRPSPLTVGGREPAVMP